MTNRSRAAAANPPDFLTEADRELLAREFKLSELGEVEGLVDRLPDGARATILSAYEVPHTTKVHCAACHASRHFKGYLVELDTGGKALIGNDCGRKQFGFDWDERVKAFNADRDRAIDLGRLTAVLPLIPAFLAELEAVVASGAPQAFPALIARARSMGRAGIELAKAARNDGRMVGIERVRDPEAERANAEIMVPEMVYQIRFAETDQKREQARGRLQTWIDRYGVKWREQEVDVGRFAGWRLFVASRSGEGFQRARALMREAAALVDAGGQGLQVGKILACVQGACEAATEGDEVLADLERFTEPGNLDTVAAWLKSHRFADFKRHGRQLQAAGSALGVPDDWTRPALPELARMKATLRGDKPA